MYAKPPLPCGSQHKLRFQGLGRGRLWGTIILPTTGSHLIFFSFLSAHLLISYPAPARLWLGLANYSPWAESAHRLFVNNVLSEHGHPYILMCLSAFAAQQQSWVVVADPVWPAKPNKIYCPALYRRNLPASEYIVRRIS